MQHQLRQPGPLSMRQLSKGRVVLMHPASGMCCTTSPQGCYHFALSTSATTPAASPPPLFNHYHPWTYHQPGIVNAGQGKCKNHVNGYSSRMAVLQIHLLPIKRCRSPIYINLKQRVH